jgi:hypothetical protein
MCESITTSLHFPFKHPSKRRRKKRRRDEEGFGLLARNWDRTSNRAYD